MGLVIEHLETRPKGRGRQERSPAIIFLRTEEKETTEDLSSVFREECSALLPEIFEAAGFPRGTQTKWMSRMIGSHNGLITNEPSCFDVYVVVSPED